MRYQQTGKGQRQHLPSKAGDGRDQAITDLLPNFSSQKYIGRIKGLEKKRRMSNSTHGLVCSEQHHTEMCLIHGEDKETQYRKM